MTRLKFMLGVLGALFGAANPHKRHYGDDLYGTGAYAGF